MRDRNQSLKIILAYNCILCPRLPFPIDLFVAEKSIESTAAMTPVHPDDLLESKEPFKPYNAEKLAFAITPYILGFVSMALLGGLVAIFYAIWNVTDVPTGLAVTSYNRVNSGFLAGTLVFLGCGLIESVRILKDEAETLRVDKGISNVLQQHSRRSFLIMEELH